MADINHVISLGIGSPAAIQEFLTFGLQQGATVTVPDVVGDTQAAGTATIEGLGLTVSVTTAYSSVVAAGLIISQDPAGGVEVAPGSNVAIVVSLGDAPVQESGSGGFYFDFHSHLERRRRRKRELEEAQEAEQELKDKVDREIAMLLHEQERKDEERKALERLKGLVRQYADTKADTERVDRALKLAAQKQTLASYEALEREFKRMQEDEEFMFILSVLADL